ncbi:MAG: PEP-CTERM sorting domain-containing protein [Candidatus Sedimenticola sp. (ex Thyasira tokunagai)]
MTAMSANAALFTPANVSLNGVGILGNTYNVTFKAYEEGFDAQSYQSLEDPGTLTFTSEGDARAAATAIEAEVAMRFGDPVFMYNEGGGNGTQTVFDQYNGYRIAYMVGQVTYNFITYKLADGGQSLIPFERGLGEGDYLALATFELAEVPLPAAVWLFGSALLGFSFFRKKGVRA